LEVCVEFRQPVCVITKSPLVTRDIDLLQKLDSTVFFSIPFLTTEKSRPFELYTPIPDVRFRAMKTLSDAGIKTGIGIAPIMLGYNDADIPLLLEKAHESGATKAFMGMIHFDTDSIEKYFTARLHEKIPTKAEKILNHVRRERDGNLRHKSFAERGKGKTAEWEIATKMFDLNYKRLGFEEHRESEVSEEANLPIQPSLF
jgi:DNA repair photolyase